MLFLKIYVLINTQGKRQPHLEGISAWVIFFCCCRTLESPASFAVQCIYRVDVVEWSRELDVSLRLSEWCCSVSIVWVQIPSREEQQKFDSSKI
jgi:hypothetical protein